MSGIPVKEFFFFGGGRKSLVATVDLLGVVIDGWLGQYARFEDHSFIARKPQKSYIVPRFLLAISSMHLVNNKLMFS